MRDYSTEEHANWVHAMRVLRDGILGVLPPGAATDFDLSNIPQQEFKKFEEALQDWATSYVRMEK
jgi:hypothetical protein